MMMLEPWSATEFAGAYLRVSSGSSYTLRKTAPTMRARQWRTPRGLLTSPDPGRRPRRMTFSVGRLWIQRRLATGKKR
jgi:hypothetical protein